MRKHLGVGAAVGFLLFGSTPLLAQGIGHRLFMRGKIVRMDAGGTVACLGKPMAHTSGRYSTSITQRRATAALSVMSKSTRFSTTITLISA